jgi:cytochrome P450
MRDWFARYGDTYRVFAPARGVYNYVINHPDDIKRVLLSNHRNYTKGEGMDRVKILLGNGIMTSEGDFWRRQRRMMQPSFHRRVIDRFSAADRRGERQSSPSAGPRAPRAASPSTSPTTSAS